MPIENIKDFFKTKISEYKEEVTSAKGHQDSAIQFAQTYQSEAYKQKIRLTQLEKKANGSSSGSGGNSGGGAIGSFEGSIQDKVWQFLIADGYSKQATAGVMGNIQQESGFISDKIEQTPGETYGEGYGLIQWSYGRKEALIAAAKREGADVSDIDFQLKYLKMELDEPSNWLTGRAKKYPFDTFKKTTDVTYGTEAFCWMFERPSEVHANMPYRIEWANKYYNEYKDKKFSSKSAETGSALAKKLINEAYKYDGLGYTQNVIPSAGPTRLGPTHYDCSSLLQKVFRDVLGKEIGNVTTEQENCGTILDVSKRQPGDLCFFGPRGGTDHVALYVGEDQVFHASDYDRGIRQDGLHPGFWPDFIVRIKELA